MANRFIGQPIPLWKLQVISGLEWGLATFVIWGQSHGFVWVAVMVVWVTSSVLLKPHQETRRQARLRRVEKRHRKITRMVARNLKRRDKETV